jgi:peptidyl-prolyl cis-trans isomerase D
MLDILRKNAQSWMVKVLFGLIVIVFVFWGVGSFRSGDRTVVAMVNDAPILVRDYLEAYERTIQALQQQNPSLRAEDLKRFGVKERVLDQLIDAKLISEKAGAWGVSISPAELMAEIGTLPAFQNESRRFDPERYKAILQENRLTPHRFETDFTSVMLMDRMREYVQSSSRVHESQARDFFDFALEKLSMDYVLFSAQEYLDRVDPTEEQIGSYYQSNQDQFAVAERIAVRHLLLTPRTTASLQKVSPEEVQAYYEANKAAFLQEEQVRARHILIKVDQAAPQALVEKALKQIDSLRQEIAKGGDFAQLARKHSEDPGSMNGGDLGWFSRGQMVEEFENVAFALEPGKVSEPVRTLFGFHLIKVEDRRQERTLSLEEVSETIRGQLAEEKAIEGLTDLLDQVMVQVATGKDLEAAAASVGLKSARTQPFSRQDGPRDLPLRPEDVAILFDLPEGKVTESPFVVEDGYLLAQKVEVQPRRVKPLDEVRAVVVQRLKQEEAMKIAREEADKALARVSSGATDPGHPVKSTEPFARGGIIPEMGTNPELAQALFSASGNQWLPKTYEVDGGVVLSRPGERVLPKDEEWEQQKSFWISSLKELRADELFRSFLENLRKEAKIEIVNPEYLRYPS